MPGAVQEATENQQSSLTLHVQELWVGQVLGQERMDCGGWGGGGEWGWGWCGCRPNEGKFLEVKQKH